jgi:hypothetical protein
MAIAARVLRVDAGSTLSKPRLTNQGFLRVDGYASRPGIYEYPDNKYPGGIRRELRPDEEVYSQKALDGFEGAPITDGHPPEAIDADNVDKYEVGTVVGPGRRDGDRVAVGAVVKNKKTVRKMESGKRELSPGYTIDWDPTPGVDPKYGRHDGVQRNIEVNHLALVERARGGRGMVVRMDAELDAEARANLKDSSFAVPDREGLPIEDEIHLRAAMARFSQYKFEDDAEKSAAFGRIIRRAKTLGVDSSGFEDKYGSRTDAGSRRPGVMTMDHEEQIRSLKAQLDDAERKLKERRDADGTASARAEKAEAAIGPLKERISDLEAQIASGAVAVETERIKKESARADEAEEALRQREDAFEDAVEKRTSLMRRASIVLGEDFRFDKLTERQIHEAVVKRLDGDADVKPMSNSFLEGKFDTLLELRGKTARALRRAGESFVREDEGNKKAREDRDAARAAYRNQGRQPLPNDIRASQRGERG